MTGLEILIYVKENKKIMISYDEIKVDKEVHYAGIDFSTSHRVYRYIPPTKAKIIEVELGVLGKRVALRLIGSEKRVNLYVDAKTGNCNLGDMISDDEEEVKIWYNSQLLQELDRLQSDYEVARKRLKNKLLK